MAIFDKSPASKPETSSNIIWIKTENIKNRYGRLILENLKNIFSLRNIHN